MAIGPGQFNKVAGVKYAALSLEERKNLSENEPMRRLTKREVIKKGEKIFKKMRLLVR